MFDFLKNKKHKEQELVNQVVGGQSVLFRMFREVFDENPDDVKKTELTYFALSVFAYTFLRLSVLTEKEKEAIVDRVSETVFRGSIPHAGTDITMEKAVNEYQKRYNEYNLLINNIYQKDGISTEACTTLTMHLYESVMGKSAKDKMIQVAAASSLVAQYIVDHIEWIKEKKL